MRGRVIQWAFVLAAFLPFANNAEASRFPFDSPPAELTAASRSGAVRLPAITTTALKISDDKAPTIALRKIRLAADLPVSDVKVCDIYGAGYFYVPGTDTCIKIAPVNFGYSYGIWCFTNFGTGSTIPAFSSNSIPGQDNSSVMNPWDAAFGSAMTQDFVFHGITQPDRKPVQAYFEPRYNINNPLGGGLFGGSTPLRRNAGGEIDIYGGGGLSGTTPDPRYGFAIIGGMRNTLPGTDISFTTDDYTEFKPKEYKPQDFHLTNFGMDRWRTNSLFGQSIDDVIKNYTRPTVELPLSNINLDNFDWGGGNQKNTWLETPVKINLGNGTDGSVELPDTVPNPNYSWWEELRPYVFGSSYDFEFDLGHGRRERFRGYYDEDGTYRESYDYYDDVCGNEDYKQTDVYDGESLQQIGYEYKEYYDDGVYTRTDLWTENGNIIVARNFQSYQSRNEIVINLARYDISRTYARYVDLDKPKKLVTYEPISGVMPTGGGIPVGFFELFLGMFGQGDLTGGGGPPPPMIMSSDDFGPYVVTTDVVPVVGDLGGPVDYDFDVGSSYVSRFYRGIPADPKPTDARVAAHVDQAEGSSTPKNPRGNGPSPTTPPATLKLFTNKANLPSREGKRPVNETGFDQNPAQCVTDKSGDCTITISAADRRFYGLPGTQPDFAVPVTAPYATSIIWLEKSGSPAPSLEQVRARMPSLPPEVRARTRQFSIGEKTYTEVMLETATFNPSPDRWKDYLQSSKKDKRGDKGGQGAGTIGGTVIVDPCGIKLPAAYVEGQPLKISGPSRELPEATIHLVAKHRGR